MAKDSHKENPYKQTEGVASFNFKSAFLMMGLLFFTCILLPYFLYFINVRSLLLYCLIAGILSGFGIAEIQAHFSQNKWSKKAVLIVGSLLSLLLFIILFSLYQLNILM